MNPTSFSDDSIANDSDLIKILSIEESRYARLEQISWWKQERIRDACVVVAGAGALGNEIVKNLVLLGVGHIIIIDKDTVDISNLTRSILFRPSDQLLPKVAVVEQRSAEINPDVHVLPIYGQLEWEIGIGVFRRVDVVFGALDSIGARIALNRRCWSVKTPFIDGGLEEMNGVLRVYVSPNGACYECSLSVDDYRRVNRRFSCQQLALDMPEMNVPTTPTMSSIIAAWQVQEFLKHIHGYPIAASQGLGINGLSNYVFKIDYQRRSNCRGHEFITNIIEIPNLSASDTIEDCLEKLRTALGSESVRIELDREIIYLITCTHCDTQQTVLIPQFRMKHQDSFCPTCGYERVLYTTHWLERGKSLVPETCQLLELGIPPLHILKVHTERERNLQVELTADANLAPLTGFIKEFPLMSLRDERLQSDFKLMKKLSNESSFIEFETRNDPPDEYLVRYYCRGMFEKGVLGYEHLVQIQLHSEYEEKPPKAYFLSPIFHPNVIRPIQAPHIINQIARMLDRAAGEDERQMILDQIERDSSLRKGRICLDMLDLNWEPTYTIDMVVIQIGHMIQYKLFNENDPMNTEAANWVREHRHNLPLDPRPLRDIDTIKMRIVLPDDNWSEEDEYDQDFDDVIKLDIESLD